MEVNKESPLIGKTSECENTEVISISSRQEFENVNFDTTMECFSLQTGKSDTLPQQMCPEESNAAFSFEKRPEETDLKFQSSFAQLDRATDYPTEGGVQVKIENEFSQNEVELNEAEYYFSIDDLEHDLSSVKVEEEKVEFHVAETYSCKDCNFTYDGLASYKTHRKTKHGDLSENSSISDGAVFKDDTKLNEPGTSAGPFMETYLSRKTNIIALDKSLKKHMSRHIDLKKKKCDGRITKGSLKTCMLTHTGDKPFKCVMSNGRFIQKGDLKRHVMTHTGEKPFKCEECDSRFSTKSYLKRHVMSHTGERLFECDICSCRFILKQHLDRHVKTHTGEKPFKCDVCDKKFATKTVLQRHAMTHTGEKPFECDKCSCRFVRKQNLDRHVMIHTGKRPYKCEICNHRFIEKRGLKQHVMTHTREKPFKCDECDRRFSDKSNLKKHVMIHTGEKPFKCDICDCRFIRKLQLDHHVMTHTGERPFKCDECDRRFSNKSNLNQHVMIHTGKKRKRI